MNVVGLITARGGSKGIPRKNITPMGGKPLLAWTVEAALRSQKLDRVILSTDDEEIAQVGLRYGAEVPFMRPAALAKDDSDHISVVDHAVSWLARHDNAHPEYIMVLQPTSPFRTAQDIDAAIQLAEQNQAVAVLGVSEVKDHPYLSKRILPDGTLTEFVTASISIAYPRRQALPPAYAPNGAIYLNRCDSLARDRTFFPPGTYAYIMPPERSLDIDSPWDLYLAELICRAGASDERG